MKQYNFNHFKLSPDTMRCSLRRADFEKFSRLGGILPDPPYSTREVHISKKEPPSSLSGYGPELIIILKAVKYQLISIKLAANTLKLKC